MKLSEVRNILEADVLTGEKQLEELDCMQACGCDLMSDVLAFTKEKTMLLTGLTNPQVIRTAVVAGLLAIIFVRNKRPSDGVIDMAREAELPLLCTEYPLFEACGMLWEAGLGGCKIPKTVSNDHY